MALGRSSSFKRMPKLSRSASFDRRRALRASTTIETSEDVEDDNEVAEVIDSDEELEVCCEEDEIDFASGLPMWLVWAEVALAERVLSQAPVQSAQTTSAMPLTKDERELSSLREELAMLRHLQAQRLAASHVASREEHGDEEDEDDYEDDFEEEEEDNEDTLDPVAGCPAWLVAAEVLLALAGSSHSNASEVRTLAGRSQASSELERTRLREEVVALRQSLGVAPPDQMPPALEPCEAAVGKTRSLSFRRRPKRSASFERRSQRVTTKDQMRNHEGISEGEGKENQHRDGGGAAGG